MKNIKRKLLLATSIILLITVLTGCASVEYSASKLASSLSGKKMVISTYDDDANKIDQIIGKSVNFKSDNKFKISDLEGNTIAKSGVLNVTVGGKTMVHVGSSLIAHEEGLVDILDEYSQTVDIQNTDRSVPFMNHMANNMKNSMTGNNLVILIRSQTGQPLATFVGDKVSYFPSEIDKSTVLMVDDKMLLIYRCDYTIYDMDLLVN